MNESVLACDDFLRDKLNQLAGAVQTYWPHAVDGAKDWGRIHKPELTKKCDVEAEEHLGELRNNGMLDEFKPACLEFFRAEMELYKAHAAFLSQEAA